MDGFALGGRAEDCLPVRERDPMEWQEAAFAIFFILVILFALIGRNDPGA